jgi:diguanylate cyclase (GGDEF)-like protein/PAS domain S-box-containing protein
MHIHPALRISVGLVFLTVSALFVGEFLQLVPDKQKVKLDSRRQFAETMAYQVTTMAAVGDVRPVGTVMKLLVKNNKDILSVGLRNDKGMIVVSTDDHQLHWLGLVDGKSTANHMKIPIYEGDEFWGDLELAFKPLSSGSFWERLKSSFVGFVLFVALTVFVGFYFLMRRALRALDPSAVIPERVRAAFDTLAEGVLIVDENNSLILSNQAFEEKFPLGSSAKIGVDTHKLMSAFFCSEKDDFLLPWQKTLQDGTVRHERLSFRMPDGSIKVFSVNASPVLDDKENIRGALATFDDLTAIEEKNEELKGMLFKLQATQEEIQEKNTELQFLAERDSLTGCLNRRSMNEKFKYLFDQSKKNGRSLTCLMVDIDHFKRVNDEFGHNVGDEAIKLVADVLHDCLREDDLLSRWGGEEFCVVIPDVSHEVISSVAERIRKKVSEKSKNALVDSLELTVSSGYSTVEDGAENIVALVNQADEALYVSKNSGRNRVTKWSDGDMLSETDRQEIRESSVRRIEELDEEADSEEIERLRVRIKQLESINVEQEEWMQSQLFYDEVTGLPRRELFCDRISQALSAGLRKGDSLAVMSLSVHEYAKIRDNLGLAAVDDLLVEISHRIKGVLRSSDSVAFFDDENTSRALSRLANNEFGILLTDLVSENDAAWAVKRLFDAFNEPFLVDEIHCLKLSVSIGVALSQADSNATTLSHQASKARYQAQQVTNANHFCFYQEQVNELVSDKIQLEMELLKGLEAGEFELHYQPRVDMQSNVITSLEALIRWNHPKRGVLYPGSFIDVAESTGSIVELGQWVLDEAIKQLSLWRSEGFVDIGVSVNLSPVQLREESLVSNVVALLDQYDVPANLIELEITEDQLIENTESIKTLIEKLNSQDIKLAIDDFGTGYSALNYLKRVPAQIVKIDRSFVIDIAQDNRDAAIVSAIISMAKDLDIRTVVEGVETQEQFAILKKLGCDEMQGYLYSKPIAVEKVGVLLENNLASR